MKFEKKVILGSVGGFIATALGIIAVFFPSLFNLEKKTMEEINIFIKSQSDIDKLKKAIEKNSEKLVKLDISYCYGAYNSVAEYNLNTPFYDKDGAATEIDERCINLGEPCKVENGDLVSGAVLLGGAIEGADVPWYPNEGVGGFIFPDKNANYVLYIPHKAKGKYDWAWGDEKECKMNEDEVPFKEHLRGIFYVNERTNETNMYGGSEIHISLEPFNKKDLKMRDY